MFRKNKSTRQITYLYIIIIYSVILYYCIWHPITTVLYNNNLVPRGCISLGQHQETRGSGSNHFLDPF